MFGYVYVLLLDNNNIYVGYSCSVEKRIKQHFDGKGSSWTKLHKPVRVLEVIHGSKQMEETKYNEYVEKFGKDKVRGWLYISRSDCNFKFPVNYGNKKKKD